ncbi:Fanconi anemia group J protein homolog isoform X2 [Panulirus ornatus]|uniref:Fanconi anemia group J protein homolog isoform X2 n=1 Tax=Panulirus ornatus TaxID=150431 RepID=UPI003A8375B2
MSSENQQQQNVYTIGGVKVQFPAKPYPSQMAMMAQIMKGLQRRQNCLLESPTGSGKSLALLCSTLAWQDTEKEKAQRYNGLISQGITDPDTLARAIGQANLLGTSGVDLPPEGSQVPPPTQDVPLTPAPPSTSVPATTPAAAAAAAAGGGFIPEDDDDDFRTPDQRFRDDVEADASQEPPADTQENVDSEVRPPWETAEEARRPKMMRVPTIFFGTRTHKQIYQIIKELRRTAYKHVRSVVLASREHTCIHPRVSKLRNKNEECRNLVDPRKGSWCKFYHGVSKIKTHADLAHFGFDTVWDIEDLVTLGKGIQACPYFAARSLMTTAEIVICPYNYLIDPLIRESMDIHLNGNVIVIDEAHNIEDSAREASSFTLTQDEILEARQDIEKLAVLEMDEHACTELIRMLNALNGWVDLNSDKLTDYLEFNRSSKIFTGTEMIATLDHLGIGPNSFPEFQRCLDTLTEDTDPEELKPRLNSTTTAMLKNLFLIYDFLIMDDMKYRDDYRIALIRVQARKNAVPNASGWISRGRSTVGWEYSINFWCLNPAVAFRYLCSGVRSIILTSGTLSPMNSFQSELAIPFKIQLEANHVIEKNQVWVGTIGKGPTEQTLKATYRNTENWGFQDELGRLVLSVCRAVPRGILCFLPSYAMLNKLLDRWQNTGMWEELSHIKVPMTEPRNGEEFEETMALFYDTIRNTRSESDGGINGAFFMAVCRGKVSEGLDFTDDNARAVIAVGIPFPSIKDIQVDLKRQYNNTHSRSRGLLSGGDWYEIQAFRAINQALGRCIRHRFDWGAIILVDERYQQGCLSNGMQQNKYTRSLSKWVRNKIVHHLNFSMALSDLCQFVESMKANPPVKPYSLNETGVSSKTLHTLKPDETSSYDSVSFGSSLNPNQTNESLNLTLVDPESELTTRNTLFINSVSQNSFEDCSKNVENFTSQENYGSCIDEFNTSVIGGLHARHSNDSDINEGDLVIPSGGFPFTSTQATSSRNAFPSEMSDTNTFSKQRNISNGYFVSAPTLCKVDDTQNGYNSQVVMKAVPDTVHHLAKSTESLLLNVEESKTGESEDKDEKIDGTLGSCVEEFYKFRYIDVSSKSSVSPLKVLLEKEINEKTSQNSTPESNGKGKRSHDNVLEISLPRKSLKFDATYPDDSQIKDEASVYHKETCSPQLFNSVDDHYQGDAHVEYVNKLLTKDEKSPVMKNEYRKPHKLKVNNATLSQDIQCSSDSAVVTPEGRLGCKSESERSIKSCSCADSHYGKESSECCNTVGRTPSFTKRLLDVKPLVFFDDSDLDDFDLDQSFNKPGEKTICRISRGKKTASKHKGVQYSEYTE